MRIIAEGEWEIKCDVCRATLGVTSEDVKTTLGGAAAYIKCPICGNTILWETDGMKLD